MQEEQFSANIAEEVYERFINKLTSKDALLPDDKFMERFLMNQRRAVTMNLLDAQMRYDVITAKMDEFLKTGDKDADKLNVLTKEVDGVARDVDRFSRRLTSVIKATTEDYGGKIINDFYGSVDPSTGVEKA